MFNFTTNKIPQEKVEEKFGRNAKILEEFAKRVDWKIVVRFVAYAHGILLAIIFTTLVVIRLAFAIF
jgi:hypothetical protein